LKFIPCQKKEIKNTNSKTSNSVYGFNPSTSEYKTWPSISECTKLFSGGQLKNPRTIKKSKAKSFNITVFSKIYAL
jgi:hypothetical protein